MPAVIAVVTALRQFDCAPCMHALKSGSSKRLGKSASTLISLLDLIEELRADDAAALPDSRSLAEIDVPVPLLRACAYEIHALRVGANLRGVERIVYGRDHLFFVPVKLVVRPLDLLARLDALVLARRDVTRINRSVNRRD